MSQVAVSSTGGSNLTTLGSKALPQSAAQVVAFYLYFGKQAMDGRCRRDQPEVEFPGVLEAAMFMRGVQSIYHPNYQAGN
jgi:hypothetical protein